MHYRQRHVPGAIVVDLSGDGIGSEPSSLRTLISSLLKSGHRHIVLNLDALQRMDSTGLAEIVASYKAMVEAGGHMNITSTNEHIRRVLRVTKVDTCVNTFESEADAVASFDNEANRTHL